MLYYIILLLLSGGVYATEVRNLNGSTRGDANVVTLHSMPLSGFYSDGSMVTPQCVVLHDYDPLMCARVVLAADYPTSQFLRKLFPGQDLPDNSQLVIQRGDVPLWDVRNLRPHYAFFNDIQPNDLRITSNYNGHAEIKEAKVFPLLSGQGNVSVSAIDNNVTAHPGNLPPLLGGGVSTILSSDTFHIDGLAEGENAVFASLFKVGNVAVNGEKLEGQGNRNYLTIHWILNAAQGEAVDRILKGHFATNSPASLHQFWKLLEVSGVSQGDDVKVVREISQEGAYEALAKEQQAVISAGGVVGQKKADMLARDLDFE